ncbi:hypothetical protein SAMN04515674_101509 [Pseudarcicella hirudinis]|uniref:Uncharacterized protein n=1 Tax=Pseudarcicella hirudinis TaxID=1079859 RepID=A0A1I5MYR1_9BACT|nr:hypothetical protein SAMN04515674_101509 [Pseudarcicella hirudinis]
MKPLSSYQQAKVHLKSAEAKLRSHDSKTYLKANKPKEFLKLREELEKEYLKWAEKVKKYAPNQNKRPDNQQDLFNV